MDFLVHAIAFSDKNQLTGRYADTTRENFLHTMLISCFAFTEAAKRAAALMPNGGAMVTLTYNGGDRAMPNYNVMGPAKAALESSVRYLAVDFGRPGDPGQRDFGRADPDACRRRHRRCAFDVCVPATPLAAASRCHARRPRRRRALSCSPSLSTGVTGEIHFVNSGYNVIAMPHPEALARRSRARRGLDRSHDETTTS